MTRLTLYLLGLPRVEVDNREVRISRRKALALLAYLAVTGQSHTRDALATLLWPEQDQSRARSSLRSALVSLRRALGNEWLETDRESVGLSEGVGPSTDSGRGFWLDVAKFRGKLAECLTHGHPPDQACPACLPPLADAAELYRGDFMAGFTLPDCPDFDEWQYYQSEGLRGELARALERLAHVYATQGEYEAAITHARRWLALDALNEPAHRLLMQLYAWSGQRAAALRQFEECERALAEELGAPPDEETSELYQSIIDRVEQPPPVPSIRESAVVVEVPAFLKGEEEALPGPVFVAREPELAQLDGYLDQALSGQGRVVFVTGEAGQGKTALVAEFARQAREKHRDLVTAGGNCSAYTGIGDPYLPFREILELLTGDVQDRWAARAISREQARRLWQALPLAVKALVEAGPDLIGPFLPGPALVRRAQAVTPCPGKAGLLPQLTQLVERRATFLGDPSLQQSALFEQYTRVVGALAVQRPLLLLLDDLQWVDSGSTNLLFHLGRRIGGSRVLIVGAYRPVELALGRPTYPPGGIEGARERHPLEPVLNELKRQFGEIEVDLGRSDSWQFVEALVDSEPNRLGEAFRETLYQRTRGHALSTVELLRDMQERGDLIQDGEGRWVEGKALDWDILPARVEAMIAERVGRLSEPAREMLRVASVEGETFTAEVAARVLGASDQEVVRQLGGLDREHRLVSAQGIRRSNGQSLSLYRFRHILFQRHLYNSLSEAERAYLHKDVGTALEALHSEATEDVAVQLARHFQEAGVAEKTAGYLSQAGDQARRLYAHQEAVEHYQQAMATYGSAFGDGWDPLLRATLERKIGEALFRQGKQPQALAHFGRTLTILGKPLPTSRWKLRLAILREVAQQIGHRLLPRLFLKPMGGPVNPALEEEFASLELVFWIEAFTNPERCLLVALKSVNGTEKGRSPRWAAMASSGLGTMLDMIPIFWLAEGYHRRSLAYAEQTEDAEAVGMAQFGLAWHQAFQGEWDTVFEYAQRAAEVFRDAGDWHKWGWPTYQVCFALFYQGDFTRALVRCQELVRVGRQRVDPQLQCWGLSAQGLVRRCLGQLDEAIVALREAIELAKAIPDHGFRISVIAELGRCYLRQGGLEEGLAALQESHEFYAPHMGGDSYVSLRNGLAEAYLLAAEQTGEIDRAGYLKRAERACKDALKQGKAFRPGLPEAMCLQGTYEWLRGKPTKAQKWWQCSLALAGEMGQRYDMGVTYLEMGRLLGQRAPLERAEAILAEIGAEGELARVREAMKVIS